MERAGATIVERTGHDAVMGVPGIGKIIEHIRMNRRIEEWLDRNRIAVHVPVDSPDANFAICRLAKERGARVVHLVAPQLWAWREGRIRKLRRLTDLVLCVLPFEEDWFISRRVPARFVGHPLFNEPLDLAALDRVASTLPQGQPRLALMPGSRPSELRRSFPPLLDAFRRLHADFPALRAVVPITRPDIEDQLRIRARSLGGWPDGLSVLAGNTDAVIRWCDMALVASGTVTLQVARQVKPMVTFYRVPGLLRILYNIAGSLVFSTKLFTLPNVVMGRRIVPEFVPLRRGDGKDLAVSVYRLMRQPGFADDQKRDLADLCTKFENHRTGPLAADAIEQIAGLAPPPATSAATGVRLAPLTGPETKPMNPPSATASAR